jgi:hypothetical protein
MGIAAYASRLQAITVDLADIGYPVADHNLAMLAGLGEKFRLQSELIENNPPLQPLPTSCPASSLKSTTSTATSGRRAPRPSQSKAVAAVARSATAVAGASFPAVRPAAPDVDMSMVTGLHQAVAQCPGSARTIGANI